MAQSGAFSWNSELPSGRSPFWLRDDALANLNLHAGEAVTVDTRAEPQDGDLVVAEVEVDGDPRRLARRYYRIDEDRLRLEALGGDHETLELPADSVMIMGVIRGRVRLEDGGARAVEEPLFPT